jgi:hypothetical protein
MLSVFMRHTTTHRVAGGHPILSFLSFHLELESDLKLVRSAHSIQKLEFQRHLQLSEIITPKWLGALGCVNNRQKTEKI